MNNSFTYSKGAKMIIPMLLIMTFPFLNSTADSLAGIDPDSINDGPKLEQTVLPAQGRRETILHIPDFGRYAITLKSPQGTALQLIDRLSGPGNLAGILGEKDGRLDRFLEKGTYKLVTYSHEKGKGEVVLKAHSFKELNSPKPPLLEDLKLIQTDLGDFEQRSLWLEIKRRQNIIIEAAGRHLTDLRLWKDGTWLVDASPKIEIIEPLPGKPLTSCLLTANLNPGLYLLSAYGGPPREWEKTSDERPLYIRSGIPQLAEAGRNRFIASPFGIDRWLTPGKVNFYRLELPTAEAAEIQVRGYSEERPFSGSIRNSRITKKSLPPATELILQRKTANQYMVTVKREAGKPYILQHFEYERSYSFSGRGNYWVSTTHSGHGEDVADATALLTRRPSGGKETLYKTEVIELGKSSGWRRRFNLLEPLTLYFEIFDTGSYVVNGTGAEASFRFEPFLINKPRNYKAPKFKESGSKWDLNRGFYVLTVEPVPDGKGIIDLMIRPKSMKEIEPSPVISSVRFPMIRLNPNTQYRIYLNRQPGVKSGVIIRELPVDLSTPLPITLNGNEVLTLEVRVPEKGQLTAISEDGTLMDLFIETEKKRRRGEKLTTYILNAAKLVDKLFEEDQWKKEYSVEKDIYTIKIRNNEKSAANFTIYLSPYRLATETPLPEISDAMLAGLPDFPELTAAKPYYLDVAQTEKKSFLVNVEKPGLYRLESNGLLKTEGTLRTRIITSFDRKEENGVGQNFLIQQYLREGEYQLTVSPRGKTRGHMGLFLNPTELNDGGALAYHIPARFTLDEGEGLVYGFDIKKKGLFRLKATGLNRQFRMRLEDADGWPLIKPGQIASLTREFDPGTYRFVILPQPVQARVVTLLEPIPDEPAFEGHGPHDLSSDLRGKTIRHVWMEPEEGEERTPDQWDFHVPAPLDVIIALSNKMSGDLHRLGPENKESGKREILSTIAVMPGKRLEQRLELGDYRLEVRSVRKNNRLGYDLNIDFQQLVVGHKRSVTAPVKIPVSIGRDGMTEFMSIGNQDVRARLYDNDGTMLAQKDDRKDDWNFHIGRNLKPGFYTLGVEPVGKESCAVTVRMERPTEIYEKPIELPVDIRFMAKGLHIYPLKNIEGNDVILAGTESVETIMIDIEKYDNVKWKNIGSSSGNPTLLGAVVDGDAQSKYRLLVQSIDKRGGEVNLRVTAILSETYPETDFVGKGIKLSPVKEISPQAYVGSVRPDRPGLFRILKGGPGISTWSSNQSKFETTKEGLFFADREKIRLISAGGSSHITAERVSLGESSFQVIIPNDTYSSVDIDSGTRGPVLVLAESRIDQPGISLEGPAVNNPERTSCMGIDNLSAIAVNLNQNSSEERLRALLWNAGENDIPLPVEVSQYTFSSMDKTDAPWGVSDTLLQPLSARKFSMPGGLKRVRLNLPPATAAVLSRNGDTESVCWSGEKGITRSMDGMADNLVLLHLGDHGAYANVAISKINEEEAVLLFTSSTLIKRYFPNSGSHQFKVRLSDDEKISGMILRLYGRDMKAVLIEENGRIRQGTSFHIKDNATLTVDHEPGLFIAWMEGGHTNLWEDVTVSRTVEVMPPQNIPLQGKTMKLAFRPPHDSLIHLNTDVPIVGYIKISELPARLEVFPEGADLPIFIPSGREGKGSYIILQSTGTGELSGIAEVQATDIVTAKEGLGPRIRLKPGGSRAFSFTMRQKGPVGIGIRATADIATCSLMDAYGRLLGKGVVQMHDLTPGDYLLSVETPSDGFGIEVQPVIIGIEPPDTGPPDDVIREYMEMEGFKSAVEE